MKLLFFDIDGTLISRTKYRHIPESAAAAIAAAKAKGHKVFINTGRIFANIEPYIRELDFDGYVCGCGTYVRLGNEVLYYRGLSRQDSIKHADTVLAHGAFAVYERYDHLYFDKRLMDDPAMAGTHSRFTAGGSDTSHYVQDNDFSFDKCFGWYTKDSKKEELKAALSPYFDVMNAGGNYFELQPKGCSKATGIDVVRAALGANKSDVYVFGDSPNDESMFEAFENSVCMGDCGEPYLFDRVKYVTAGADEDGLMQAMRHFDLI